VEMFRPRSALHLGEPPGWVRLEGFWEARIGLVAASPTRSQGWLRWLCNPSVHPKCSNAIARPRDPTHVPRVIVQTRDSGCEDRALNGGRSFHWNLQQGNGNDAHPGSFSALLANFGPRTTCRLLPTRSVRVATRVLYHMILC
jgi:hypothetical protein